MGRGLLAWSLVLGAWGAAHGREAGRLLEERCLACHDASRQRGGLDLSSRATALKGGDSGPALVSGDAARSLLLKMVGGPAARMPRSGPRLTEAEVRVLRDWIAAGAP